MQITREEFYEKYGDVKVKFVSYYKYTFTYAATLPDDKMLFCEYGGNSDDIYKLCVGANEEISVIGLQPFSGYVQNEDRTIIDEFYDY